MLWACNICYHRDKKRTTHWLYPEEKQMCSSWHSRSVANTKLESREWPPSRPLPWHCYPWGGPELRMSSSPPPASSLRLTNSNRNNLLSQLLTVNTLSNPFSSLCLKEHRTSTSFLVYPHNILPAQVYIRLQVWKRGRKSLTIYTQSSSPVLSSLNHGSTSFYST